MRNSEYRTSFSKLNQKKSCSSYLDNLIYRRSRRNYESNHDHLVFCWDDQDWTESASTTSSCDGNDSASTSSRQQVATVKDKIVINDKNKTHHNEPSKPVKYQEIKNNAGQAENRHHRINNRSNYPDANKSQSSSPKEPKTKNVAIQTVNNNARFNNCLQKSKSGKEPTKNTSNKEKKTQVITNVANKKFLQNRSLVVYGLGWKDNLCGPRRTFNILADNGVYKSAQDAQERRAISRQKVIRMSANEGENKPKEDKDLNLWDTSRWKSEYQRCFSP